VCFKKSSVFAVQVSPRVPCLPPAVGLGRKKTSIGKGRVTDSPAHSTLCCAAEDGVRLPPAPMPTAVPELVLSLSAAPGTWRGLTLALAPPALVTVWLCYLLEGTVSKGTVLVPPPSLHP